MRIPKFWEVAEDSATGPSGERVFRRVWGWSMSSAAEALDVAQERLRSALANIRSGTKAGGYYPRVPLREPILDEVLADGEQILVVTRNRYGAEVLNTDRVLIADVDLPGLERSTAGLLRRLFGKKSTPDPGAPAEPAVVVERLAVLADWASAHPNLGVIIYRTASGLRVFVTGVEEPASSARGEQILGELGTDPIYRELCRTHGTFRARLTPKPWRLRRIKAPRGSWPFQTYEAEFDFERWLSGYDSASAAHAVCRRVATHGPAPSTVEALIIQRHDERTRATSGLPLA